MNTLLASRIQPARAAAEAVDAAAMPIVSGVELAISAVGLVLLALWLLRFGGPKALTQAPTQRHCLPLSVPFLLFFVWILLLYHVSGFVNLVCPDTQTGNPSAVPPIALLGLNTLMITLILATARKFFARGLKGFGLNPKTLPSDAFWAGVNLLAAYPLVLGGIWLVIAIGRLLAGDAFTFQTHQSLEELSRSSQASVRWLMVLLLVGVVPIMEELLFRGLLQSALQAILPGRWPAIVLTSALFAIIHPPMHAPGIFALACVMGYAYERTGSLGRPICIHIFFNGLSVATAIMTA